jgi:hypothetical protein
MGKACRVHWSVEDSACSGFMVLFCLISSDQILSTLVFDAECMIEAETVLELMLRPMTYGEAFQACDACVSLLHSH